MIDQNLKPEKISLTIEQVQDYHNRKFVGSTSMQFSGQVFGREPIEPTVFKILKCIVSDVDFRDTATNEQTARYGVKFLCKNKTMLRAKWTKNFPVEEDKCV